MLHQNNKLTSEAAGFRISDWQALLLLLIFHSNPSRVCPPSPKKPPKTRVTDQFGQQHPFDLTCLQISAAPGCIFAAESTFFVVPLIENNMKRCCRPKRLLITVKDTILLTLAHSLLGSESPGRRLVGKFHDTMQLSWKQILLIIFLFKCRAGQRL